MSREEALDSEERASLALGAMKALRDLIAGLDPRHQIPPGDFVYLFIAVEQTVRAAIALPCEVGGLRANDDD